MGGKSYCWCRNIIAFCVYVYLFMTGWGAGSESPNQWEAGVLVYETHCNGKETVQVALGFGLDKPEAFAGWKSME